ncbi:hypothetical protein [Aeoliella mucimassa]|uniref:Uncharacterized protein n=1 Tax=Aeoliella mucimassa TaxID=2527972 RepID=A0A518AH02_9BACT|nr:hypothetical protein [Aeoliella mucimassa]QDU54010.1 hypothetical protein Pan181_01900 [Aeoliella mucimassa]
MREPKEQSGNATDNPYQSPQIAQQGGPGRRRLMLSWSPGFLPFVFTMVHTAAIGWYALYGNSSTALASDSGLERWTLWCWIDFPIGTLALFEEWVIESDSATFTWLLMLGGAQWALWGWIVQQLLQVMVRETRTP